MRAVNLKGEKAEGGDIVKEVIAEECRREDNFYERGLARRVSQLQLSSNRLRKRGTPEIQLRCSKNSSSCCCFLLAEHANADRPLPGGGRVRCCCLFGSVRFPAGADAVRWKRT